MRPKLKAMRERRKRAAASAERPAKRAMTGAERQERFRECKQSGAGPSSQQTSTTALQIDGPNGLQVRHQNYQVGLEDPVVFSAGFKGYTDYYKIMRSGPMIVISRLSGGPNIKQFGNALRLSTNASLNETDSVINVLCVIVSGSSAN